MNFLYLIYDQNFYASASFVMITIFFPAQPKNTQSMSHLISHYLSFLLPFDGGINTIDFAVLLRQSSDDMTRHWHLPRWMPFIFGLMNLLLNGTELSGLERDLFTSLF